MSKESQKNKEKKIDVINEESMMERGKFTANGYTFIVRPVFLGEEEQYLAEMTVMPTPNLEDKPENYQPTDKELGTWAIALFGKMANGESAGKRPSKLSRLICWLFHRNDYHYYSHTPVIQPLVKWLERKVTYNGRKIRFYDLERKFGLNKSEIEKLIIYFHELSNF